MQKSMRIDFYDGAGTVILTAAINILQLETFKSWQGSPGKKTKLEGSAFPRPGSTVSLLSQPDMDMHLKETHILITIKSYLGFVASVLLKHHYLITKASRNLNIHERARMY